MKHKYTYTVCSICKQNKEPKRSPYCKDCNRKYQRRYKLLKSLKPNIDLLGLNSFIKKIEKQNLMATQYDMLNILFFYEIITKNINEFDQYESSEIQLTLMWDSINKWYKQQLIKDKNNK